jgi:outer membrane protein assembly factor BamB
MKPYMRLTAILLTLSAACVFAADWPQYYGPRRDGTSTEKGLLRTWPKEGPKVLWTVPVGIGFGGPAVSGGKVYLLDRDDKVGDNLRCFDLANGKELWSFAYDALGRFDHPGSRGTPTVDGGNIYACGPLGDLYCISASTHKPVWNKNIWKDFGGGSSIPAGFGPPGGGRPGGPPRGDRAGGPPPGGGAPWIPGAGELPKWGISQNPLIYGNLLIVAAQTSQAGVVAYDKLTGELKWKSSALSGSVGYVSPSIGKVGGEDHLVMAMAATGFGRSAGGGSVNGLDPLSGKVLWTYDNWKCVIPVPHAVDAGEGRMLITGGYNAGAALIKVQKKEDGSYGVTELFKNVNFGSHTQPPILYREHFYTQYTTNERSDGLVCMSMDGQVKWKTGEEPAFNKGGSILADGLLLATDGNTKLYLISPDPSGFKPLASAEVLEPGENWAPIALVDGKLLIRDQKQMKCVVVGQQSR